FRSNHSACLSKAGVEGLLYSACLRCHATETLAGGAMQVSWTSRPAAQRFGGYSLFTHHTHLIAVQTDAQQSCQNCHQLDTHAAAASVAGDVDPPRHGFLLQTRSQC